MLKISNIKCKTRSSEGRADVCKLGPVIDRNSGYLSMWVCNKNNNEPIIGKYFEIPQQKTSSSKEPIHLSRIGFACD